MEYSLGRVNVTDLTANQIVEQAFARLNQNLSTYIVTLNPEIFVSIKHDQSLCRLISSADFIVPDGQGIVWAVSKLYKKKIQVCPGVELAELLIKQSIKNKNRLALIGGTEEQISGARKQILAWGVEDALFYTHNGYFQSNYDIIVKSIIDFNPNLVLVGMGFPKQDLLIETLKRDLTSIYIGIGGSIKIWAGLERRAPKLFRTLRMEWVWRTLQDPARIKRLIIIPKYISLIYKLEEEIKRHKVDK